MVHVYISVYIGVSHGAISTLSLSASADGLQYMTRCLLC